MSNILIIKHGSLGDIAQASGAIQDIFDFHKGNNIYLLTTKPYFNLFKKNPHLKDTILEKIIQKKGELKLYDIKRKIIKTDHNSKVPVLFDQLLRDREHLSLVIDKQKKIKGIVTLEDIIETALGFEIVDETDTVVDLQVLAKQRKK